MVFDAKLLEVMGGLTILANRIVAAIFTPIFDRYGFDKTILMYVAWIISGVFVWLSGINLFDTVFRSPVIGQIITALVAGGGANLLHDLTDKA